MARTNYQRGRDFEYRVRDRLLKEGAEYVMRAASSKGAADLIALWPFQLPVFEDDQGARYIARRESPRVWLVQCKRDGRLPKDEEAELVAIAGNTGAIPVLARVPKSGRGVEFINLYTKEPVGNIA